MRSFKGFTAPVNRAGNNCLSCTAQSAGDRGAGAGGGKGVSDMERD